MSFAALKRLLEVGKNVTITHHGVHGPGDTMAWGNGTRTLPFTREIAVRQGNAIAFAEPQANGGKSWLYWPAKASEVTIADDDRTFTLKGMTFRIED